MWDRRAPICERSRVERACDRSVHQLNFLVLKKHPNQPAFLGKVVFPMTDCVVFAAYKFTSSDEASGLLFQVVNALKTPSTVLKCQSSVKSFKVCEDSEFFVHYRDHKPYPNPCI